MKPTLIPLPVRITAAACFLVSGACLVVLVMAANLAVFKDSVLLNAVIAAIMCNPDEHLVRENPTPSYHRGGSLITTYCISQSQRRDVTLREAGIGLGGFGLLFAVGFGLLMVTFFINTKSQVKLNTLKAGPQAVPVPIPSLKDAEAAASDQLLQLEEKYKAGLVTHDEYHQMRREILKKIF